MSDILNKLQQRRRKEVKLGSGLVVGYHLPDLAELIVKVGQVPAPAVAKLAAKKKVTEADAASVIQADPAAAERGLRYTRLLVAAMLDDIDGEDIAPDDDREAITEALDPDDKQELFLIGTRQKDPDSGEA